MWFYIDLKGYYGRINTMVSYLVRSLKSVSDINALSSFLLEVPLNAANE